MKIRHALTACLFALLNLTSCSTPDYDPSVSPARPYVPRVTMPLDLNRNEQNLIGDVENMLEQSGLRPTDRAGAEYQLAFSVEDGPVNADVRLELFQGRDRIAQAFARTGGPRIIFKRQQVIRESFDKAMREFEPQLPRTGAPRQDAGGGYQESYQPQNPYGSGPAQPNPYGQDRINPDYSY